MSRKTAELRNFFLRPQRGRPSLLRPQRGRPSLIPPATRTPLFAACSATAEPICTINRTTFIMCGASAAPMPRHRSASTDLRSTTATAVPKHGGRSTSFHQLCLCAKSSSTARLCRDAAAILPTRRLIGHRAALRSLVESVGSHPHPAQVRLHASLHSNAGPNRPESPDTHLPRPSPPVHACNHWASDSCNEHKDPQVGIHRPNLQPNSQGLQTPRN